MVIATPFDKRGTLWTKNKPTSLILKRIIIFAKASLETLQNNLFSLKDFDVKVIIVYEVCVFFAYRLKLVCFN